VRWAAAWWWWRPQPFPLDVNLSVEVNVERDTAVSKPTGLVLTDGK